MTPKAALQRYHSLDALRAIMMSLGIVIHGAFNYLRLPPGPGWAFRDPDSSVVFDIAALFIHLFRMPVFFVVAGFFAAFLYLERGEQDFIRNRIRRIVLPLAVFWPIVFLLTVWGFWYATGLTDQRTSPTLLAFFVRSLKETTFIHMWFLYDLLWFYAVVLVAVRIPIPVQLRGLLDRVFRTALKSPFRAFWLGCASLIVLIPAGPSAFDLSASYIPDLAALLAYGMYFTFGWLLYRARDLLSFLQKGVWIHIGLGLALFLIYLKLVAELVRSQPSPDPSIQTGVAIISGFEISLLVFGLVGLFMKYLESYNRFMRYIADASYWIYLVHLPLAIWVPAMLVDASFSPFAKFLIVEAVILVLVLVSYHYCVRSTLVGVLLNGRRYPRSLPPVPEAASP